MKFILFLFFIILTPIFSEDNLGFKKKQNIDTNELEVFSEKFFREKKLEGKHVLVAIVKDNKSFFKVYPEHSKAFTELTQFNSVVFDEIFLTLHTLHLEEIGKLNLRSDIYNYKWKYNRNFKQSILIENLLTHTTGIQENLIYSNLEKERPKDFWKNQLPARFAEPNELISYNPDHSVILKSILEEVNSKSLDEVMKETILSKLELEKTNYENQKLNINAKDIEKLLFLFLNPD
ncbi:MAG TPA: serine hydrolase, partial [Leptospiraceae bacterium]|nr:serine hydrolase [Leptospiraceae bacterium]